jgi:hypothetical protein
MMDDVSSKDIRTEEYLTGSRFNGKSRTKNIAKNPV